MSASMDSKPDPPGQGPGWPASGSATAAESVPGYRNLVRIRQGGFSVVYRAIQEGFDRRVALKILNAVPDEDARRRFERELRLTSRLSGHPHVVTVLDAGQAASGQLYLAMDFFDGGSLKDRIAADGPLSPDQVAAVGVKIGDALAAAHALGVVHRDVKPNNILVSRFGEPALADFGVSCLLDADSSVSVADVFTPRHAAPELISRGAPNEASDIYALGSTLYQLLTGHSPFGRDGEDVRAIMWQIINEPPPRPDCQELPGLSDAIVKAIAKDPADRFPDAASFARALRGLVPEVVTLQVTQADPADEEATTSAPPAPPVLIPAAALADITGSSPAADPDSDGSTELRPDRVAPKHVAADARRRRRRPALLIGGIVLATCVLAAGAAFATQHENKASESASARVPTTRPATPALSGSAGRTAPTAREGSTGTRSSPGVQATTRKSQSGRPSATSGNTTPSGRTRPGSPAPGGSSPGASPSPSPAPDNTPSSGRTGSGGPPAGGPPPGGRPSKPPGNPVASVFWKGGNGDLWEAWGPAKGSLSQPFELGMGTLGSDPTAGIDARGDIYVYWEGSTGNHDLWEAYWDGSRWSRPYDQGMGPLGSAPSAAVTPGGTAYVFWKGADGDLWEAQGPAKGRLNTLSDRGMGTLGSGPAAATDGKGDIYVYHQGAANQHIWEAYFDGSALVLHWEQAIGVTVIGGASSAAVTPGGNAYVFWKGVNGDLWEAQGSATGSLSPPADRGMGTLGSDPAAAADSKGDIYVYHEGAANQNMWEAYWDGSTLVRHWEQVPTYSGGAPTVVIYG